MADSDVRERFGQSYRAGRTSFDLVPSKLRRPLTRPGTVRRSSLIERLIRENLRPIVSVVAPAGYGKTTLLSQWAECHGQAFAWVSVDEKDNDPKVLLTYVARALATVEPIGEPVFDALASASSSVSGSVMPRLGAAFASMRAPVVLVLDDVHLLQNRECRSALSVLADHVPPGSRLVLASRSEPPLRIARLRTEGRVLEIGPGDLSLSRDEAGWLLRDAGLALGGEEITELYRRTEGWPAGLYLAALYVREGGPVTGAVVSFGGDDRFVTEYVESEFLARISAGQRWPNGHWWLWRAANGARPRTWPAKHVPRCARPGSKTATSRRWSARYRPVRPSTAAISRPPTSSWSAPSARGLC
jgi:LuxR family transcriptional regulator, maltose regulon positive regulatory protein